jgi:hypothetical protein
MAGDLGTFAEWLGLIPCDNCHWRVMNVCEYFDLHSDHGPKTLPALLRGKNQGNAPRMEGAI